MGFIKNIETYINDKKLAKDVNLIMYNFISIKDYYKKNALNDCHEDLEDKVVAIFNTDFSNDKFGFNEVKDNIARSKSKKGAKNFSLLCLAHMVSKLTRNSKYYDKEVVDGISELITDIHTRAKDIINLNNATQEDYFYDVMTCFNADKFIIGNFDQHGAEQIKNTREKFKECFENKRKMGYPGIDYSRFKKRTITKNDEVYSEDIDFYFKDFAKIVEGNMFGWDNSTAMLKSAELCGLIQRYDKQNQEKLKVRTDNYSELNKEYQEHLDEINKMLENQDNNDNVYANMAREYERDIFQSNVPKK